MDGNKDEALRCLKLAEAAIALKDKEKALKFIKIAKRLDSSIQVDGLLTACEGLDNSESQSRDDKIHEVPTCSIASESSNGDSNYTEEHVKLIREIKKRKDTDRMEIMGEEMAGENQFSEQKAHHRCRRKKHDWRLIAPSR